jgi:hypothetical integral membrane protein (TIGR02206 family)
MDPPPFSPWGPSHVIALAVLVAAITLLLLASARLSSNGVRRLGRVLAATILAVMIPFQIYSAVPSNWDVARSLPFELCDLAWMVSALALWTGSRPWTDLTYYWGLTLTTQAIFTPRLEHDFPSAQFWMFWLQHGLIVAAAIYTTWRLPLRPSWRGYGVTVAVTLAWAALMFAFNSAFGANYLFVNSKPAHSVLDFLGDWPWYLLPETALIAAIWALITWPWIRARS